MRLLRRGCLVEIEPDDQPLCTVRARLGIRDLARKLVGLWFWDRTPSFIRARGVIQ